MNIEKLMDDTPTSHDKGKELWKKVKKDLGQPSEPVPHWLDDADL